MIERELSTLCRNYVKTSRGCRRYVKTKTALIKELSDYDITYCLFSVSGFNDDLEKTDDKVMLFNNGELIDSGSIE